MHKNTRYIITAIFVSCLLLAIGIFVYRENTSAEINTVEPFIEGTEILAHVEDIQFDSDGNIVFRNMANDIVFMNSELEFVDVVNLAEYIPTIDPIFIEALEVAPNGDIYVGDARSDLGEDDLVYRFDSDMNYIETLTGPSGFRARNIEFAPNGDLYSISNMFTNVWKYDSVNDEFDELAGYPRSGVFNAEDIQFNQSSQMMVLFSSGFTSIDDVEVYDSNGNYLSGFNFTGSLFGDQYKFQFDSADNIYRSASSNFDATWIISEYTSTGTLVDSMTISDGGREFNDEERLGEDDLLIDESNGVIYGIDGSSRRIYKIDLDTLDLIDTLESSANDRGDDRFFVNPEIYYMPNGDYVVVDDTTTDTAVPRDYDRAESGGADGYTRIRIYNANGNLLNEVPGTETTLVSNEGYLGLYNDKVYFIDGFPTDIVYEIDINTGVVTNSFTIPDEVQGSFGSFGYGYVDYNNGDIFILSGNDQLLRYNNAGVFQEVVIDAGVNNDELNNPNGIMSTTYDDRIIVSEIGGGYKIFNKDGTFLQTITFPEIPSSNLAALTFGPFGNTYAISNYDDNNVEILAIYDEDYDLIKQFSRGDDLGRDISFDEINSFAVDSFGDIQIGTSLFEGPGGFTTITRLLEPSNVPAEFTVTNYRPGSQEVEVRSQSDTRLFARLSQAILSDDSDLDFGSENLEYSETEDALISTNLIDVPDPNATTFSLFLPDRTPALNESFVGLLICPNVANIADVEESCVDGEILQDGDSSTINGDSITVNLEDVEGNDTWNISGIANDIGVKLLFETVSPTPTPSPTSIPVRPTDTPVDEEEVDESETDDSNDINPINPVSMMDDNAPDPEPDTLTPFNPISMLDDDDEEEDPAENDDESIPSVTATQAPDDIIQNEQDEFVNTAQEITADEGSTGTIANIASVIVIVTIPLILSSSALFNGLTNFGLVAFPLILRKKDQNPWGVVIDKKSRIAVVGAQVSLYKAGRLIDQTLTDKFGRYSFALDKGKYNLSVKHPQYEDYLIEEVNIDDKVADEDIELLEKKSSDVISPSSLIRASIRGLGVIYKYLFVAGFIFSVLVTFLNTTLFNVVVSLIYVVSSLIYLYQLLSKNYYSLRVVDKLGKPVENVIVRFVNYQDKVLDIRQTNIEGFVSFATSKDKASQAWISPANEEDTFIQRPLKRNRRVKVKI